MFEELNMVDLYDTLSKNSIIKDSSFLQEMLDYYPQISYRLDKMKGYGNSTSDYYNKIVSNYKSFDHQQIITSDYESFYIYMTNKWIDSILSLTPEQLQKTGDSTYEVIKDTLIKFSHVEDLRTIEQIYNELESKLGKKFEKQYFWRHLQRGEGFNYECDYINDFTHIKSKSASPNLDNVMSLKDVKYRLYINAANKDIFHIVKDYIKYCEENKIPYYFKYGVSSVKKDDTIVFYVEKKYLKHNIQILQHILKKNLQISEDCQLPPILTSLIDGKIGIASEPDKAYQSGDESFNSVRAKIIEDSCETAAFKFLKNNFRSQFQKQIEVNGKMCDFNQFVIDRAAEIILRKMEETKNDSNIRTNNYIIYLKDKLDTIGDGGIRLITNAFKMLEKTSHDIGINSFLHDDNISTVGKNEIKYPDGTKFCFSLEVADAILKDIFPTIVKNNPDIFDDYRDAIRKNSTKNGVDPNNFSFNLDTLEEFKSLDAAESKVIFNDSDVDEKKDYHSKILLSNGLELSINSALIGADRMYKLPNGNKWNAYQYMTEFVSQFIPASGVFKLKSGVEMSATQFVEEYILGEIGQITYNGDIGKLLNDYTMHINATEDNYSINSIIDRMAQGEDVLGEHQEEKTNNKQLGFAMLWVLGLLTGTVSVGLLLLGTFLK